MDKQPPTYYHLTSNPFRKKAMLNWLMKTDARTRWFYLQAILYALLIMGSTFFIYGRLDYVRSYRLIETLKTENS